MFRRGRQVRNSSKIAAVLGVLALLAVGPAVSAEAVESPMECHDVTVAVALAPGTPKNQQIYGRLCAIAGTSPSAVQVLVHGIGYDHRYWSFPDPAGGTNRYDYTAAATKAGFATLAIDRIGAGRSSRPLGALVTIESNAHAIHDVVQAIRSGSVRVPGGNPFSKVVYVGHSYGSWTGWYETTDYNDVDAFVITGATHKLAPLVGPLTIVPNVAYPALLDPQFGLGYLDPTYLTTVPGKRYNLFYSPAAADPAVLAYDEAHKGGLVATEIATYPLMLSRRLDIRVPVLLVGGTLDSLFCGPQNGGADCSTPSSLIADEAPYLGDHVPSVDAVVDPQSGHVINMSLTSQTTFTAMQKWISHTTS